MCFALPLKVKKIERDNLIMEDGRVVKLAIDDKVRVGDFLICQQNLAVEKITKKQAQKMRQAIKGVSDELK